MTQFILLRSCATDFDHEGRIKGTLDLPLSQDGVEQAIAIAPELANFKIDAIYYSPCQSAEQTAELLSGVLGSKGKLAKNMHNLNQGLWQGKLIEELKEKQKKAYRQWQEQPESVCPPEGETVGEAQSRIKSTLDKLVKKHKKQVVLLIVPEPLHSLARCYLENSGLGDLWETICDSGSWTVIDTERPTLTPAIANGT